MAACEIPLQTAVVGHPAGPGPLLVLDMMLHAQADRADLAGRHRGRGVLRKGTNVAVHCGNDSPRGGGAFGAIANVDWCRAACPVNHRANHTAGRDPNPRCAAVERTQATRDGSQSRPPKSVATSWQHPYRPYCPMCPESGRYGRFRPCWTYLNFSYKVEGLVDRMVRGGSSPLERTRIAQKSVGFGAREDTPVRRHGGPWQRFGNIRAPGVAVAVLMVFMPS